MRGKEEEIVLVLVDYTLEQIDHFPFVKSAECLAIRTWHSTDLVTNQLAIDGA